jgi:hypothetical protein
VTIAGSGFSNGATVKLTKAGQTDIAAVNPTVTATSIGCDLPITGAVAGPWNVTVTNPDGQFDNLTSFQVLAPYPVIDITQTSPAQGENTGSVTMTIIGSYFVDGATVKLTKFGQTPISASNVNVVSSTKITCTLDLGGAAVANDWRLWVTNPDGQSNSVNNLFQFAIIAAKSATTSSSGGGGGGGSGYTSNTVQSAPAAAQNQPAPEAQAPSPVDTGKSAGLNTNTDGVITQEMSLQSNDNLATVSIPAGIVAIDAAGTPLTSVSIAALSASSVPADVPGSAFAFAGRAYELGPDGATFSPAITLTFTVTDPQEGQTYAIRMFDHATNAWVDLPTAYHPESKTVTTEVSGFCCFALFSLTAAVPTVTAPVPTVLAQPVPSPVAGTPMGMFMGVVLWSSRLVRQNLLVVMAIVIVAACLVIYARKRGRDRRKRELFKPRDQP